MDSFNDRVKCLGAVEFTIAVALEGVVGFTPVEIEVAFHTLERLTVTSNPAKTPVSIETVSCFAFRSIENLAVSPTLNMSVSVVSITLEERQIGTEEPHVILGDIKV